MQVCFKNSKLHKVCSDDREMRKTFGERMCQKLQQRLAELSAVDTLDDMSYLPPARCHQLTNRDHVFSVDLEHPFRMLFRPAHEPTPLKMDGGIDRQRVTKIEVIAIEDTHDKKKQRRS